MKTVSLVGLGALLGGVIACSGRYEVGGEAGAGGEGAGRAAGGSATAMGSGGLAGGRASSGGFGGGGPEAGWSSTDATACEPESAPPPLLGDLVEPEVVWQRVTRLIEGEGAPPPSNLPTLTTYAWAGDVVTQAFARARLQGSAPGALSWLSYWLFRTPAVPEPALEADWSTALLDDSPVLERLMLEPVAMNRQGVFAERAWLLGHSSISSRGAGIFSRVFGREVPASPVNAPATQPSEELTRRQELRVVLDANVACAACHALMDDLGYAYGHFDELGEYEESEDGLPIDTSGRLGWLSDGTGPEPALFEFADQQELGLAVAESCEARKGVAVSFARAALGLEGVPQEAQFSLTSPHEARLEQAFLYSDTRSYEDLVRAYAQSPLVLQR